MVVDRRIRYITPATTYIKDEKRGPARRKFWGSFAAANASQILQNRTKRIQFRQIFAPAAQQTPFHNSDLDRSLSPEVEFKLKYPTPPLQLNGTFHLLSEQLNTIPDYRRCMTRVLEAGAETVHERRAQSNRVLPGGVENRTQVGST